MNTPGIDGTFDRPIGRPSDRSIGRPFDRLFDRREALAGLTLLAAGSAVALGATQPDGAMGVEGGAAKQVKLPGYDEAKGLFVLGPLPYDKAALEPHIDAATMEIHHGKHHKSYVDGLNKALAMLKDIRDGGDAGLVKHWSRELSFHGSGHVNHTLFWQMMAPEKAGGGGQPKGALAEAITRDFGSFEKFVAHFKAAAGQVEGSGWAWLVVEPLSRRLMIVQQEKQQDMMPTGSRPVLGVDVWEHAYYLKYQNKRSDYVTAFMKVVNWSFCEGLYAQAIK